MVLRDRPALVLRRTEMGINAHDLATTTPIDELRTMYREELAL
jgi:hypothetical protein